MKSTPFVFIFLVILGLTVKPGAAHASLSVTDSFTSTANKKNSDMVWNTALGELHPPLFVNGFDKGSGGEDYNFSVGDGSAGDFINASDYESLSCASVSGNVITINTNQCSDLNFKRFRLLSGWTIRPTGANPLVIRSLSYVTIEGSIDCSGGDGEDANSSYSAVHSGGSGRCGGGDGGNSVLPATAAGAANQGEAGGSLVNGGDGGGLQDAGGGQGGGGGGGYVKTYASGTDSPDGTDGKDSSAVTVGNVGANHRDDSFEDDLAGAGSGGGGGSAFYVMGDPGNSSGGGGGAGGGNVQIYAVGDVTIAASGGVYADGGDGGEVASPYLGGGGGGGAGGSILIMTVGDIENNGAVSAAAGAGGTSNASADGGDGYWGRTWLVEKDGYAGGANIESPETKLNVPGNVRYETGVTYTVLSKPIDLGNSQPSLLSSDATVQDIGGATLDFQVAFGDSEDAASLNNFAAASTYVGQTVGRFARFQIQLDNTDNTTPARVTMIDFTFDGHTQNQFNFVGACGGVTTAYAVGLTNMTRITWMILFLFPLGFLLELRRRRREN